MKKDRAVPATSGDQDVITAADIQALLSDLNIDSLMASLDPPAAEQPVKTAPPAAAGPAESPESPAAEERRSARRVGRTELSGDIRMTIPGVSDILMVNISETGALIETSRRLSPGVPADLFVRLNGKRHTVRATAVRSTLHAIASNGATIYRTALQFDTRLPLEAS